MNTKVLFSSNSDEWATPQDFFDRLNEEFHFNLDPCALPENAKCSKYFTPKSNGLSQNWGGYVTFCNPPYGRKIYEWVKKCYDESRKPDTTVVLLIPIKRPFWGSLRPLGSGNSVFRVAENRLWMISR